MLLGGCTLNPATGEESFTGFMSPADEAALGKGEHPKIIERFGGVYADAYGAGDLAAYIGRVGRALARVSDVPNLAYTFTILNTDTVNAFAVPGGYVYVTRGLIALAGSEAEIAGVLAHEIGHITARHTAQRYSKAIAANVGLTVLGVLGSAAGLPPGLGDLASLGAQAYLKGFSREQEMEADMLGVRYLSRGGYDPQAMVSFFRKLQAQKELEAAIAGNQGGAGEFSFLSTHPRTADRLDQAIALATNQARLSPGRNSRVGRDEYLDRIDGMLFGDDPSQGVRRGRVFSHPGLRIQFQVPTGFSLVNAPGWVAALGPGGSLISFDMVDGDEARGVTGMAPFIARQWGKGLPLAQVERIFVNGMAAATGSGRMRIRSGARDIRLVAIRERRDRIYRFLFITPPRLTGRLETELRRTTYSFRRLSPAEAQAIRPLRLRLVTARPGDTPESLADTLPMDLFRLDWFRLLNGLAPGQPLTPGRRVKVIDG